MTVRRTWFCRKFNTKLRISRASCICIITQSVKDRLMILKVLGTRFVMFGQKLAKKKGSNEITSSLYHRLRNTDLIHMHSIRLFADGCGGQNKNKNFIGMESKWFVEETSRSLQKLLLVFPVVSHSFIPPDRVFGKIERALKKMPEIVDPIEYESVNSKFGSVIHLGDDCFVYD
ncbi:hypothetical protein PR048_025454 [Dryococelus australis]|uniref:Uncharacterized protein n=1 Tax=Dryococelus australis TaxID=614101 RepID=A0ABQ9GRF1_9NEOP|nr:hypothetical protein PR048_025454 [Dryococelus australis]